MSSIVVVVVAVLCGFITENQAAESARARLAIGLFTAPFDSEEMNRMTSVLPDLLTVELSKSQKFDLLERERIDAAFGELKLSAAGAGSTTNMAQLGQLLSAEWLVSGSFVVADGKTNLWIKVIDMAKGVVVAVQPLACLNHSLSEMAEKTASFVTGAALRRASQQFIGLGEFQDLSLPTRGLAQEWTRRLPALIEEHFHGGGVGLVERSLLTPLLEELRLQDGGFAAQARGDMKVQPAFWLVDGGYKWFRDRTNALSAALRIERVGYREQVVRFTAGSPEDMLKRMIELIEESIARTNAVPLAATARDEAAIHLARGHDLAKKPFNRSGGGLRTANSKEELQAIHRLYDNNRLAAVREYETSLLLDPSNLEAKLSLAGALLTEANPANQRAMDLLMEVAASERKDLAERAVQQMGYAHFAATNRPVKIDPSSQKKASVQPVSGPVNITNNTPPVAQSPRVLPSPEVVAEYPNEIILASEGDSFWIGNGRSLLKLNKGDLQTTPISLPVELKSPISSVAVRGDTVWLGTASDGLLQTTKSGSRHRLFTEQDGLFTPSVTALRPDGDKLWVGFGYKNSGGLGFLDLNTMEFIGAMSPVWLFKTEEEHLRSAKETHVISIHRSLNQSLWIGSWGGLQQFDPESQTWATPLRNALRSVAVSTNRLAALSHANIISVADLSGNTWRNIDVSACFTKTPVLHSVALDGDTLWLAGQSVAQPNESKLAAYDLTFGEFTHVSALNGRWTKWIEVDDRSVWTVTSGKFSRSSLLLRMAKPILSVAEKQ